MNRFSKVQLFIILKYHYNVHVVLRVSVYIDDISLMIVLLSHIKPLGY